MEKEKKICGFNINLYRPSHSQLVRDFIPENVCIFVLNKNSKNVAALQDFYRSKPYYKCIMSVFVSAKVFTAEQSTFYKVSRCNLILTVIIFSNLQLTVAL